MKDSARLQAERAHVERVLTDSVICDKCQATLATYADKCSAGLSEICPGFIAIENERAGIERVINIQGKGNSRAEFFAPSSVSLGFVDICSNGEVFFYGPDEGLMGIKSARQVQAALGMAIEWVEQELEKRGKE